ncbi:MAG: di-trans,poly-cis-decaprenylcistransferase [Thermoanaerobaculia bacterium]|nr:MAG: di-trans,poly-cis-decaprenylcistransferase [Thermoanaerobaculia bacterium]MBZ0102006.1 di-trans,poly-cis-decaprenylcistransferase [Thermoanaerobaculia bacterium]
MADPGSLAEPGTPEAELLSRVDLARLPRHVAIIMDGNGRWARQRHLPRVEGHRAGVAAVRDTVEAAARLGLEHLTLYAFSVENWKRPRAEVWTLMNLLKEYLRREIDTLVRHDIRFAPIGRWRELDPSVVATLERGIAATAGCRGMRFNIALNYSGRCEIVDACRSIVAEFAAGRRVEIDEATLSRSLYTAGQPDPDLLIRTSGEMRVSNFLLWQIAYSEIRVTPVLWPDFRRRHLLEAVLDFQGRERRFGGVGEEAGDDAGTPEPAVRPDAAGA